LNASIALPPMEMNTASPDIMTSVMNGMGAAGLGAGAAGGAGMAAMQLSGLTAFGFKGNGTGLKGYFYDLKQTPKGAKTDAAIGAELHDGDPEFDKGVKAHAAILHDFFSHEWDESVLNKYFRADQSIVAPQIMMPIMHSEEAPKAFGVDKQIKGMRWLVHYKGKVTTPRDGSFRFVGWGDDFIAVRFDKKTVFLVAYQRHIGDVARDFPGLKMQDSRADRTMKGEWFQTERGKVYDMEVVVSEAFGGRSTYLLMIEEKNPSAPYPKKTQAGMTDCPAYPVFQVMKGVKVPEYNPSVGVNDFGYVPETAPEPVIFQAK